MWFLIEFIVNIFENVLILNLVDIFFERKYENKLLYQIAVFFFATIFFVSQHVAGNIEIIGNIIGYISIFAFVLITYENKYYRKIIAVILFLLINMIIELVVASLLIVFLQLDFKTLQEPTTYRFMGILISKLLLYTGIRSYDYYVKHSGGIITNEHIRIIGLMFAIDITLMMIIREITKNNLNNSVQSLEGIAFFLTAALGVIVIYIYEKIRIQSILHKKMNEEIIRQEAELRYIKRLGEMLDEYRRLKHDINNHVSSMKGLLDLKEYDRLEAYFSDFASVINSDDLLTYGNSAVLSILHAKHSTAKKYNIKVDLDINIKEEFNLLAEADICSIIGNLLDNAIEASKEIDEDKRFIRCFIKYNNEYLYINICNQYNGCIVVKDKKIVTTKKDFNNHGIGLKSVKTTINKYEGYIDISYDENEFEVKIMLYDGDEINDTNDLINNNNALAT